MKNLKLIKQLLTSHRWQKCTIFTACFLLICALSASQALGQSTSSMQPTTTTTQQIDAASDSAKSAEVKNLSAWDIIQMSSWLFWPFVLLTGVGIMLLSLKALQELQEKSRSAALLDRRIGVRDLKGVVRQVQEAQVNRASRLFHSIIATFNKTNRAEPIGDDINTYLNVERESFETFHRVIGFLSDTAGALGLLGTVWGIFETFHSGTMDGPTILQGMSVSLVTTLIGLVISLMLNAGATSIFSLFNKQLNLLASRAEDLRQVLLFIETKQAPAAKARTVSNSAYFARKPKSEQGSTFPFSGNDPYGHGQTSTGPAFKENAVPAGYAENGQNWP